MRYTLMPSVVVLLLGLHAPAFGQPAKDIRYVIVDQLDARCGPGASTQLYPTNRLRRGAVVEVVKEENGWLAIHPPEGSFSYVNARFLQHIVPNQDNYVVTWDGVEAPVYIGSELVNDHRPDVFGVKLKRGTQVVSVGKVLQDHEGTWMPIEPPPGEVRWVPAQSVDRKPPSLLTASNATSATGDARSSFAPVSGLQPSNAPSANPPVTLDTLYRRAQQFESSGQTQDAIRLYTRIAHDAAQSNPHLANEAAARANFLLYGHQTYGASVSAAPTQAPAPAAPRAQVYPLVAEDPGVHLTAPSGAHTVSATGTAVSSANLGATHATSTGLPPGWGAYKGWLRAAGRVIESQQTYVVETDYPHMRPVAYVVASPNIDLKAYVGKLVEVQGPAIYRGDIRNNYLTVMRISPQ